MNAGRTRTLLGLSLLVILVLGALLWLLFPATGKPSTATSRRSRMGPSNAETLTTTTPPASRSAIDTARVYAYDVPASLPSDPLFVGSLGGVRGRFVDLDGTPVAGLQVTIWQTEPERRVREADGAWVGYEWESATADTGRDGVFNIHGLAPCLPLQLSVRRGGSNGLSEDIREISAPSAETLDLGDIVLPRGHDLIGRVLDPAGEALANALVQVTNPREDSVYNEYIDPIFSPTGLCIEAYEDFGLVHPPQPQGMPYAPRFVEVLTDADGRFRSHDLPPIGLLLSIQVPGQFAPINKSVDCAAAQIVDAGTFQFTQKTTVRCRVVDADGRAVDDAEVLVAAAAPSEYGDMRQLGVLVTREGRAGRYELSGYPRETVTFAARRPNQAWTTLRNVDAHREHTLELDPLLELRVSATAPDGLPVHADQVRLIAVGDTCGRLGFVYGSDMSVPLVDRRKNRDAPEILLTSLSPGTYELQVEDTVRGLSATKTVDLTESTTVPVRLQHTYLHTVLVTDTDGVPIRHARLDIGFRPATWTRVDGTAEIEVSPEDIWLEVWHPAFVNESRSVEKSASGPHVKLRRNRSITARIRVPTGKPRFEYWRISVKHEGEVDVVVTQPDSEGTVYLQIPKPGTYTFKIKDGLDRDLTCDIAHTGKPSIYLPAGQLQKLDVNVSWQAPEARGEVRGLITIDGEPAVGVTILRYMPAYIERSQCTTDANGRFEYGSIYQDNLELDVCSELSSSGLRDCLWSKYWPEIPEHFPELLIELHSGSISGQVIGGDGRPLVGVTVEAVGELIGNYGSASAVHWARTNERGEFETTGMAAGTYDLEVTVDEDLGLKKGLRLAPAGKIKDVIISVQRKVKALGTVDWSGLRIGHEGSAYLRIEGPVAMGQDVRRKEVSLGNLLPGRYRVTLTLFGKDEHFLKLTQDELLTVGPDGATDLDIQFSTSYHSQILKQAQANGMHSVSEYLESLGMWRLPAAAGGSNKR